MKYLLIFLIISACGKHQEPEKLAFLDNLDQEKRIVGQEGNIKVSGSIHFSIEKTHSIALNNEIDLNEASKSLLTKHAKSNASWKYTSPYIVLNLVSPDGFNLMNEVYYIDVEVKAAKGTFSSYLLLENKKVTSLAVWEPLSTIRLDKQQFTDLLTGNAHLALEKSDPYSISAEEFSASYPVFFNDGNKTQIFRVPNETPIKEFLKNNAVAQIKDFDPNYIFYNKSDKKRSWWLRSTNDFHSVVFAAEKELHDAYLKGFELKSYKLSRKNGYSDSITIKKHEEAKVLLNITGSRMLNVFKESTVPAINTKDPLKPKKCELHYLNEAAVKSDFIAANHTEEILMQNVKHFALSNDIRTAIFGNSIELKLNSLNKIVNLSLGDLAPSTYREVGLYKNNCGRKDETRNVNLEHDLTLQIEALVEIIPE